MQRVSQVKNCKHFPIDNSGAGTAYPSGASVFTPCFYWNNSRMPGSMLILTWVGIIFVKILHLAFARCIIMTNIMPTHVKMSIEPASENYFLNNAMVKPPCFYWDSCYSIFRFMCMFCRSLFVLFRLTIALFKK
jgi:hypothetical protein